MGEQDDGEGQAWGLLGGSRDGADEMMQNNLSPGTPGRRLLQTLQAVAVTGTLED